jgi:putative FmdB family regulatory protein
VRRRADASAGLCLGRPGPRAPAPTPTAPAIKQADPSIVSSIFLARDCPTRGHRVKGGPSDGRARSASPTLDAAPTRKDLAPASKTEQTRTRPTRDSSKGNEMPSYIYECRPCGKVFTARRPMAECDLPTNCPDCGTTTTRRLFKGPTAIQVGRPRSPTPTQDEDRRSSQEAPGGPWNAVLTNCKFDDNNIGMKLDGNIRIRARNTELRRNVTSIDVGEGAVLYDTDTHVE